MSEIKLKAKRKNTDDWLLFGDALIRRVGAKP